MLCWVMVTLVWNLSGVTWVQRPHQVCQHPESTRRPSRPNWLPQPPAPAPLIGFCLEAPVESAVREAQGHPPGLAAQRSMDGYGRQIVSGGKHRGFVSQWA